MKTLDNGIKIYNKALDKRIPTKAIYVGRPSVFGNLYHIWELQNRRTVVNRYELWLTTTEMGLKVLEIAKKDLKGKDLICWCVPEECHAEILAKWANA